MPPYLYVSTAGNDHALVIFDAGPTSTPDFVGMIRSTAIGVEPYIWNPGRVFVAGAYAYVPASTDDGLSIIDISDPTNPIYVSRIFGAGLPNFLNGAGACYVRNGLCYVVSYVDDALTIVDVSNPNLPTLVGSIQGAGAPPGGNFLDLPQNVYVDENLRAYVAARGDNSLTIIDVSNPAVPVFLGNIAGVGIPNFLGAIIDVVVIGIYAYTVAFNDQSLSIFNISNPAAPFLVGTIAHACLNGVRDLHIYGNYAYTAAQNSNALGIFNISNPAAPAFVSQFIDAHFQTPSGVIVPENAYPRAYILGSNVAVNSCNRLNVANPAAPIWVSWRGGAGPPNYMDAPQHITQNQILLPTVQTDPATGVVSNSAQLNGTLVADGGEACDCGFEWGETVAYGNTTPTQSRTTGLTFSQIILGLSPNTVYHFRSFATNGAGTSYGADRTFTTPVALPTVTTDPATGIVNNSASLNGILSNDGGEACDCGFEWGETIVYGSVTPTQSRITGQTFAQTIYPLKSNTTYYFRAFATNSEGTSYGAQRSFITPQVPYYPSTILPQVQTNPATLITEHTARLNGEVVEDGGVMGAVRFQWGLTSEYGNNTPWQQGYGKSDSFFANLTNLAEGQGFHFRAQFRVGGKVINGADASFNTLSPLGPVTLVDDEIMQLLLGVA